MITTNVIFHCFYVCSIDIDVWYSIFLVVVFVGSVAVVVAVPCAVAKCCCSSCQQPKRNEKYVDGWMDG